MSYNAVPILILTGRDARHEKVEGFKADDGTGVSEDDTTRLTQRGTRLDEAVNGHGLDLAIARIIAGQHNGQLNMGRSSKLGGFYVETLLGKSEP